MLCYRFFFFFKLTAIYALHFEDVFIGYWFLHLKRYFCCTLSSVYMGDTVDYSYLSSIPKPGSVVAKNKAYKNLLIASLPKSFVQRNHGHLISLVRGRFGIRDVGGITFFLLKVAALEIIRRFSKSRCPCIWRGLQALQILCYPPFKWIQRWEPFKNLVDSMQVCYMNLWTFHLKYILITF